MKNDMWFKRKRYGWGWVPTTWQGWLLVLGFIGVVILEVAWLGTRGDEPTTQDLLIWFAILIVTVAVLLAITIAHAPKGKWRWGKKADDNPAEDF